jgi:hypothetical protein
VLFGDEEDDDDMMFFEEEEEDDDDIYHGQDVDIDFGNDIYRLFLESRVRVSQTVFEVEPFVLPALFHVRRIREPVVEVDFAGALPILFGEPVFRVLPVQTVDALDVGAAFRSMFREEPVRRSPRLQAKARINYSGMC